MIVINDSSSLILMAKAELLATAFKVFGKIQVPKAVFLESVEMGKSEKKFDAFVIERAIEKGDIVVSEIKGEDQASKFQKDFNIGLGESESIQLYLERNADLLGTDDKRAMKVCRLFGIKIFTVLSFLAYCADQALLPLESAGAKIKLLGRYGRYTEDELEMVRMKLNGEKNAKGNNSQV